MQRTITIAAAGEYVENTKGKVFAVKAATAAFDVQLGHDSPQSVAAGSKIGPGEKFKRIRIINTSGADNTITFYAGDDDVSVNAPTAPGGNAVNALIVSAAAAPTEGIVLIAVNDTIQQIAPGSAAYFTSLRIHPAKAVVNGILTANALGDVYVGRSAAYLPDKRAIADVDYPVVYDLPAGQKMALSSIRIRGKAGDGVFFSYTPAS